MRLAMPDESRLGLEEAGPPPRANLEVRARDRANGRAIPGAREVASRHLPRAWALNSLDGGGVCVLVHK